MKRPTVVLLCALLTLSCASEMQRSLPVASTPGRPPDVRHAFSFGSSGQSLGQFRTPSSIAVDSFGNLLVADTGNNRIQKFDAYGHFLLEFGGLGTEGAELNRPTDAVENSLSVYVVDSMNERVLEYGPEGRFISVCVSGETLDGSGRGFGPRKLAFSESGYGFLTDVEADAVIVLSKFWEPISVIGGFGSGEGHFADPLGITCTRGGEVLVCDSGNGRLQILDTLGNFVALLETCSGRALCEPVDVDAGPDGSLYVVDRLGKRVLVFNSDRTFRCEIPGSDGPSLVSPCAVAASSKGIVYIVDGGADVVHAFETKR
ncbi:MAG: NHL repeat-containing protein [Candidatus Eisenbacteria bacterium]|nr:NHL repeat-containing protein [Candidatus Eisenbacteria bacterium]